MSDNLRGACIIGQSGGPSSVLNATAYGVISEALASPNITNVYGAAHGIKGVIDTVLYDMASGEYKLYLNLPDPYESIHNDPRFSIRLANENVWEAETGYNYIATINVE